MHQRFSIQAGAVGAVATMALSTAIAVTNFGGNAAPAGAHYRQGFGEPVCTVDGASISCTGTEIGGVGNTDADLVLSASYGATVQCRNKGGQVVEVKTQFTTTSSSDSDTRVRNGTLTVSPVSLSAPSDQTFLNRASCPNGNWSKELVGDPAITSFSYTLTFHGYTESAIVITG